jgi:succinate dehydrogenase/fumarate reductase-like Fe-S protein
MKKQTAVEWLVEELNQKIDIIPMDKWDIIRDIVQQAKSMENEQMDKISEDWWVEGCAYMKDGKRIYESFEQYYNKTYGGEQ